MKKLLLVLFSAIAFSVSAQTYTAGSVYAQYGDVAPDKLMAYVYWPYVHQTFDLNIFGDSTADIQFIAHGAVSSGGSSAYLGLTTLDPNMTVAMGRLDSAWDVSSSNWVITKVARPLNAGDAINASGTMWEDSLQYMTDHSGSSGWIKDVNDWIGGDRYVGFRYVSGPSTWYGWIRVNVFKEDSAYVKDYSYAVATVGLSEQTAELPLIYPNPAKNILWLESAATNFDLSKLVLSDLAGRNLAYRADCYDNKIRLDLTGCAEGCYLLRYSSGERSWTHKVFLSAK